MYSYFKTCSQLLSDTKSIGNFLIDAHKYYAHTSRHKKPETLEEHVELVQKKFERLVETHKLDKVIDDLICEYCRLVFKINTNEPESEPLLNFIKKLFVGTIVFHDFGKVNENFQAHPEKMNNPEFSFKENPLSTHHSALGAYLYIVKHIDEIVNKFQSAQQGTLLCTLLGFSYSIFQHHAKFLNDKDNLKKKISFSSDALPYLHSYLKNFQFVISDRISKTLFENHSAIQKPNIVAQYEKLNEKGEDFSFFLLTRLSFSLLTASDYLATADYCSDIVPIDFGTLNRSRIEEIYRNVTERDFLDDKNEKANFNKNTYLKLENYGVLTNPKETNGANLNVLRQEMAIELIQNIRKNKDKNLFYIEAPTGGGKTNLSMLATIELLKSNEHLNKVYYVFPFTTLITQTHKAIIETFGLSDDEVVQLHSKAGFSTKEENSDGEYGSQKINYIDNLFVNYPFCLLSHIKFFDLLKTNEKESNYLLHRLANSVVVIDELQSYNPSHWDKVIYLVRNYAKYFNIKFILMSATLPKLDKLDVIPKEEVQDFVYLLPNAKNDYFRNPNFSQRVSFKFDLLKETEIELALLTKTVFEKSAQYAKNDFGKAKPVDSVYTIIEFIFKKSATEFYREVMLKQENEAFFDEVFVLSGTILEHRRKYIINYLKDSSNRKKKILLITTQVVEAGVDIDMDLGFKNMSLIDSDEQLAGRINRNVNKKDCELYLFKINEPSVLYGKDKRYKMSYKIRDEYESILLHKDFDRLYSLVLQDIDEWNNKEMALGFKDYKYFVESLNFQKVHAEFKLIEQKNISVFVPIMIAATEENFSRQELDFLKKAAVITENDKEVNGSKVFDLYINLIENRASDFISQQVNLKTLQGILSKFVFSIFDDSKGKNQRKLILFSDLERKNLLDNEENTTYGYFYLEHYKDVYDEEFGLDESKLNNSNIL